MTSAIKTVGIYLTEGERRLLISLASDLEIRERSTLRGSESPEATQEALVFAATRHALRKLMNLPAARSVMPNDQERAQLADLRREGIIDDYPAATQYLDRLLGANE